MNEQERFDKEARRVGLNKIREYKERKQNDQLVECKWCLEKHPYKTLWVEPRAGNMICNSCMEKFDKDEEQRNSFGGPA